MAWAGLFGYKENARSNLDIFPQWLSVLERHVRENVPEGDCSTKVMDKCHLENWHKFLNKIQGLAKFDQIRKVNEFANEQKYILDIENYGLEDYWATPKQFLYNNGDCEDYAITKMMSLNALGFSSSEMKLVVLQDTNLRIPHAVLAVDYQGDTLIMDNQIGEVISHRHIVHYVPIYSVNQTSWWMYLPDSMK
ncbi:MAG: transglutaminase-like cysteine peptidase [Gammaproteobacteria bacterium]|nr:transglutaminase-like cysteine peptidase [Gammaproteobacteria bacterium]MCW8911476.1 transglutaminase-like cysteine peptidase [Gammaproteobacteria bacterium]MCW9005284.1 transglutaminase-like cysteine peptidase [Gammaproteobacteria bacterium]MCW9055577.1 transglutaminase-like cysteine peptidase [Gammaproteobacteria bacterium]